jgi:hypothetical protein
MCLKKPRKHQAIFQKTDTSKKKTLALIKTKIND